MITQKEIIGIAQREKVKTLTIDKDWVLGHFLNAMYSLDVVRQNFVFKGGTCLRKCYVQDYRFSEDLDFTLLDDSVVIDAKLISQITKIATENSGAKFYFERKKIQRSNDKELGFEIKVKYWGADHNPNQKPLPPERWTTTIKLDISHSENVFTKIEEKEIFHQYSDKSIINNKAKCYSIIEVVSEKLRSLIQRNRPRDIYDLWTLSSIVKSEDYQLINETLFEKAKHKNIEIKVLEDFVNDIKKKRNKRAWNSSLGNHLPVGKLPDFDEVYVEVSNFVSIILNHKL